MNVGIDTLTSNSSLLTILNSPPPQPQLNLPANLTSVVYDTTIELNWSNVTDIDGDTITYYLEVGDDSAINTILRINSSITETDNTTETNIDGIRAGLAYWRVLANDGTNNSTWSEIRAINFSQLDTNLTLFLNGISANRDYEYDTHGNITGRIIGGGSLNITDDGLCLSINAYGLGDDFQCGNGTSIAYNISITVAENEFRINNLTSINLTVMAVETS